jgi:hypothetical protein
LDVAEILKRCAWEECRAVGFNDICGEEFEGSAAELLDLARSSRGMLCASARLHPKQFGTALVEFMIADGIEVDADEIHRCNRGLVDEERRDERACAIMSPAETVTLRLWPLRSALAAPAR